MNTYIPSGRIFKILLILIVVNIISSCYHGIEPKDDTSVKQGISGTIFFKNWPDSSTLLDLRLIIFENYPPVDIFTEITNGRATVYPSLGSPENLPFFTDSTDFLVGLNTGVYEYIVVAQQFGTDILNDWRAVGQYDTTLFDSIPTSIEIVTESIYSNVNIFVDFDSLPGQPF